MSKTLLVALLLAMPAQADDSEDKKPQTCAQKEQRISERLQAAEEAGNERQVRGLTRALAELRSNCSEAELAAARSEDLADSEAEVAERREDLAEAIRSGDQEKINKREGKLAEALKELGEARAE